MMNLRSSLLFLLLVLGMLPSGIQAGGSVFREDIDPILAQSPGLRQLLNSSMEIEETGSAMRLGRFYTHLGGTRVGPYEFLARSNNGDEFRLMVDTTYEFLDAEGNVVTNEENMHELATAVSETLAGIRLEPLAILIEPGPPTVGDDGLSMSDAEQGARTAWIRSRWNEISQRQHIAEDFEFQLEDDPFSGALMRLKHPETGDVESVLVDVVTGDHGGFSEQYFYWDGEVFFVLRTEFYWSFDPQNPNQTIDYVDEQRLYYADGKVYRALSKKYQYGSETEAEEAMLSAVNEPIEEPEELATAVQARGIDLRTATTPAAALEILVEE